MIEIKRGWHSNGQLMYEIPYKNGLEHGLAKWWDSNGQPMYEIQCKNGQQHGAKIEFKY